MRVVQQPGFILHHYPYGETSALLEVFTPEFGRVGIIAKGARRAKSDLRAILCPFQPLSLGWTGKGELATLTGAEMAAEMVALSGKALYCGFYVNELTLRLLHRHDPHEGLFAAYRETLHALLAAGQHAATLRLFEKRLLQELGYGLVLDRDAYSDTAIDPDAHYLYIPERGPLLAQRTGARELQVRGASLLALHANRLDDASALQDAKLLLRAVLAHHMGDQPLHSRRLFQRVSQTLAEAQADSPVP